MLIIYICFIKYVNIFSSSFNIKIIIINIQCTCKIL